MRRRTSFEDDYVEECDEQTSEYGLYCDNGFDLEDVRITLDAFIPTIPDDSDPPEGCDQEGAGQ